MSLPPGPLSVLFTSSEFPEEPQTWLLPLAACCSTPAVKTINSMNPLLVLKLLPTMYFIYLFITRAAEYLQNVVRLDWLGVNLHLDCLIIVSNWL